MATKKSIEEHLRIGRKAQQFQFIKKKKGEKQLKNYRGIILLNPGERFIIIMNFNPRRWVVNKLRQSQWYQQTTDKQFQFCS